MDARATDRGTTGRNSPTGMPGLPPGAPFTWLRAAAPERVRAFWRGIERLPQGAMLAAEDRPRDVVILSGWACEQRFLSDGRRQIFSFLLPGDPVEIQPATDRDGRSILALTRLELVEAGSLAEGPDGGERVRAVIGQARRARRSLV